MPFIRIMTELHEKNNEQHVDALDLSTSLLKKRLREYEQGLRTVNIRDIITIRTALLAERPTVDHYLTVIINEFDFLYGEFALLEGEKQETIMRFLNEFRKVMQRELLGTSRTYNDGILMSSLMEKFGINAT